MKPLGPRVLPHLRPARAALAVVVAGQVVAGGLVVAQAFAVTAVVVALVGSSRLGEPALALLAVTVLRALVGWGVDVAAASAAAQVGTTLRRTVLRRVLALEATALASRSTGALAALATRGVAAIEPYLTRYLPALFVAAVLPPLVVVAIASQDVLAGAVVLATLPLVPVFAALIGMATRERADRQWAALAQLSGHFVDVVRGLPTLVAHRRARAQAPRIREITDRYRRANTAVLQLAFASSVALELIATISVALVAVVTGLRLAAGSLSLETALVVLLLAPEAYWPLRRVGAEFHAAAEGTATFEEVDRLVSAEVPTHHHPERPTGGALHLHDVTITWPGRSTPTVTGLEDVVPATGLTVLTGPSGCGKSTVLTALLGELPLSDGSVEVGTTPLADLDPDRWRAQVAHLPQRPWLIDGTVAANVRLGRPDASDADIRDALATCGLRTLPLGLALAEDGAGLSAGQRARLALARVVLSERPYVLLDEPSAHLDAETEQLLLSVVRRLARDRCVLAVAHSPAWTTAADHLISLPPPLPDRRDAAVARPSTSETSQPLAQNSPTRRSRSSAANGDPASTRATATPRPASRERLRRLGWGRLGGATALGVLASTSGVALTATAGWLITRAAEQPPVLMLLVAIVGVRTFGLARPVLRYAERLLGHDVALRMLAERRAQVFDLVVPLVPARLGRRRGDLLASLVDDVDALLDEQLRVRMPLRIWLGTTALTSAVLVAFDPVVAVAVLLGSLSTGALAWSVAHRGAKEAGPELVEARAEVSRRALTLVADARPLVHWQVATPALDEVARADDRRARAAATTARWSAAARALPVLGAGAGVVGVAALLTAGEVGAPVAALLALVPLALADVVAPVADAGSLRAGTRAAGARIDALRTMTPAVVDPADPAPAPAAQRISLDRVTAAWDERPALGPVDLELAPGRTVAVVGPSGCGKSTLAAVLVRFLQPTSGRHTLDGLGAERYRADDVRAAVGLLDDPYLFASSVVENVRLARPEAADADVEGALRAAHLGDWLDTLPDGLHTRLGDGAMSVSGGERARLGIARLLLADHPVLVLDEPTVHLDRGTARAVTDELLRHGEGRAVVWISHDAAAVGRMDEVLDLAAPAAQPVTGGSVFSRTSSADTPGASWTSSSPRSVTSSTHRSVMMRCTTPRPV